LASGAIAHATDLLRLLLAGQRYGDALFLLADAVVEAPLPSALVNEYRRTWGDADRLNGEFAMAWIRRVARANVLTACLLADALTTLSAVTSTLTYKGTPFPTKTHRRLMSQALGQFFAEFRVPDGAAYELEEVTHGSGFKGLAAFESGV